MSKCWNCGLQIKDPVNVCPLCKCIVEPVPGEETQQIYPFLHAEKEFKKIQLALNIYTFAAIAAAVVLIGINYAVKGNPGWVIIIAAFLVYGFITLKVSIQMHTGYRLKMIMQTLLGEAVLVLIDTQTGFSGWSLNYVLPAVLILMDLAVVILMAVNNRNWQSYIPLQLFIIALCVIPVVLYYRLRIVTNLTMAVIAMGFAVMVFVGTLIVGGKRARAELYRRFHM